uniref:Ubiquitin-like domain-containing protein n=1 Tax=Panagrolaimus superbus TaxID=310955 RepID=A0A914Z8R5_9BILA
MAERDNSSSSNNSNSLKKNESRLARSPLNSEKKKQTKKSDDSTNKGPIPQPMKYKPKSPPPANEKVSTPEEEESDSENLKSCERSPTPKVTVISFGSNKNKSSRKSSKKSCAPQLDPDAFFLTVETIMTAAKPLILSVTKSKTIGSVKTAIRAKTKAKNFGIYLNNKELAPEDSTLESHGIISDTKVRLHIKTQSGTSDKEDINSLIRLTKSMNDLRNIIQALPSTSKESKNKEKNIPRNKQVINPEKKAEEDQKSRDKMAKLREKFCTKKW